MKYHMADNSRLAFRLNCIITRAESASEMFLAPGFSCLAQIAVHSRQLLIAKRKPPRFYCDKYSIPAAGTVPATRTRP
jgi:hypothetical protein